MQGLLGEAISPLPALIIVKTTLYNPNMTLLVIFAILGGLSLLAALFGGRIRLGRLNLPRFPAWTRLAAALAGVLLLGLSIRSGLSLATPPTPAPAVLPSTGIPGVLTGPVHTATPNPQDPVIESIQTHLGSNLAGSYVVAYIHFRDPNGDAYEIAFAVVASSDPVSPFEPEQITASPQEQQAGTVQTLEWACQGSNGVVALKAIILDRTGHRSNIYPFLLDCG